jgi:hypothetical protein
MTRKNSQSELESLRLPELQQRYREVLGEETRCPNRTFLLRKIREALEANPSASTRSPTRPMNERLAEITTHVEVSSAAATVATRPRRPRSVVTIRRAGSRDAVRGRFKSMTVEELQTLYRSVVGRDTGSSDRGYLIWKVREAEKGRVPIGPREERTRDQQAKTDRRILPLRLDAPSVAAIDATWRAKGLKSRMDFFRRALGHYLTELGAHAAAAMFVIA